MMFVSLRWPGAKMLNPLRGLPPRLFELEFEPFIFMLIWLKFRFLMFIITFSTRSMNACVEERLVSDCMDGSWSSYFIVLFSLLRFCLSMDSRARDIWSFIESREFENALFSLSYSAFEMDSGFGLIKIN